MKKWPTTLACCGAWYRQGMTFRKDGATNQTLWLTEVGGDSRTDNTARTPRKVRGARARPFVGSACIRRIATEASPFKPGRELSLVGTPRKAKKCHRTVARPATIRGTAGFKPQCGFRSMT